MRYDRAVCSAGLWRAAGDRAAAGAGGLSAAGAGGLRAAGHTAGLNSELMLGQSGRTAGQLFTVDQHNT